MRQTTMPLATVPIHHGDANESEMSDAMLQRTELSREGDKTHPAESQRWHKPCDPPQTQGGLDQRPGIKLRCRQ